MSTILLCMTRSSGTTTTAAADEWITAASTGQGRLQTGRIKRVELS